MPDSPSCQARTRTVSRSPAPLVHEPVPTRQECLDEWAAATGALATIPMITRTQACAMTGTALVTWDSYVSRNLAPQPIAFHPHTGVKMWDRDAVEQWNSTRVRRGRTTPTPK